MGCRNDYLEANESEVESNKAAKLLIYVYESIDKTEKITAEIKKASTAYYGDSENLEKWVIELCSVLRNMSEDKKNKIIYDGRNPKARDLADWWDRHQKADLAREEKEAKKEALIESARAKLTPDEIEAIGIKL